MALFGSKRDANLIKSFNREVVHNIIEQQVGYYKPKIDEIVTNLYGEALNKTWIGPVLIKCLIDRGKYEWKTSSDIELPDNNRTFQFRFIKEDLQCASVFPEVGDAILWDEEYYEIDGVDQNRLFLGKDPDYSYSDSVSNFGGSLHVILDAHYTREEKLGIRRDRL